VQSLSERDLVRYGLKVSEAPPPSPLVDRTINTLSGPVTIQVPQGIDPGFAYNPGKAAFGQGSESLALERHGQWSALKVYGERAPLERLPVDPVDAPALPWLPKGDAEGLRARLREALGADELIVEDPTGARIRLSQAIVDHMLAAAERQDGRDRYFPFLRLLMADPAEIWVGWAENAESGRVLLRRRYVKLIDLDDGTTIGIIADADQGEWSGFTFFRGRRSGAATLRTGLRVYRRAAAP
jgi:hypothetical protein